MKLRRLTGWALLGGVLVGGAHAAMALGLWQHPALWGAGTLLGLLAAKIGVMAWVHRSRRTRPPPP